MVCVFKAVGVECGVWGVGCGVWGVGCGVWGVGCGVWGVGLRAAGADSGPSPVLPSAYVRNT